MKDVSAEYILGFAVISFGCAALFLSVCIVWKIKSIIDDKSSEV